MGAGRARHCLRARARHEQQQEASSKPDRRDDARSPNGARSARFGGGVAG